MKLRFSLEARHAIEIIESYYLGLSFGASQNVMNDIDDVFILLREYPHSGKLHGSQSFRTMASSKYKFVVTYTVNVDYIEILDVYRYQNRDYS